MKKWSLGFVFVSFLFLGTGGSYLWAQEVDRAGAIEYFQQPDQTKPLEHILPQKGILFSKQGLMKIDRRYSDYVHSVDFENREVKISKFYINRRMQDSLEVWSSYYSEIGNYAYDINKIGLRKAWLNSLIGVESADSLGDSNFDIELPFALPPWLKDFGLSKPKLELKGNMKFWVRGSGTSIQTEPSGADSDFNSLLPPSFQPGFDGSFQVKGKIGNYITIEVKNSGDLGVKNEVRVTYKENKKGEFEDHIIQEIEAGTTQLDLPGTELTGYSESHKGLFGIKGKFKIGDYYLTAIASQEGGSQESYSLKSGSRESEFKIRDKEFVKNRHYFLDFNHKNNYVSNMPVGLFVSKAKNLKLYTENTSKNLSTQQLRTLVYVDKNNTTINPGYKNKRVRLLQEGLDYSVDNKTGIVSLKNRRSNFTLAGTWDGDAVEGSDLQLISYSKRKLELEPLMAKMFYSVGYSKNNEASFRLNLVQEPNRQDVIFLQTLGLVDSTTGLILRGDENIFMPDGELRLPCQNVFSFPENYTDRDKKAFDNNISEFKKAACLEPMRLLGPEMSQMYDTPLGNLSQFNTKYHFKAVGRIRSTTLRVSDSYSVNSGGCIDIAEGSEKLKIGSTTLKKGVDYEILYELGQIELISDRAKDPNAEVQVSYECEPLFRIDNKFLFGMRGEYFFERFGEGSIFGTTFLYKTQSTNAKRPQAGQEPFNSMLLGSNLKLTDNAKWMDAFINGIPFIYSKDKSNWELNLETAYTWHNPNTKGSALLDDFENSKKEMPMSLRRQSWRHASPPGGSLSAEGAGVYQEKYDYRHMGEFIWHSNTDILFHKIYNKTSSSAVNSDRIRPLTIQFKANDQGQGKSWGGIMRANSEYYSNMSQMKYIELVVQGRDGDLFIDLGNISEDISISGKSPNGELNSELSDQTQKSTGDKGLDETIAGDEDGLLWTCSDDNTCSSSPTTGDDLGRDNFDGKQRDLANPDRRINGTEGNEQDLGGSDTEDLNRNQSLDLTNEFIRYRIPLHEDSLLQDPNIKVQELNNGWRKIILPLWSFHELQSTENKSLIDLLQLTTTTRLWIGNLPQNLYDVKLQIARFSVIGNNWEEGVGKDGKFISKTSLYDQIVDVGSYDDLYPNYDITPKDPDSQFVEVRVINNRDDISSYFQSPNTEQEYSNSDDTPLREQALVMRYGNLEAEEEVYLTRFFDFDYKDLTAYKNLKMEIHIDSIGRDALGQYNKDNIRFAVQMGRGSLEKGEDYYEWSFRPKAIDCDSLSDKGDCHNLNWYRNAFKLTLSDWTRLKSIRNSSANPILSDCAWDRTQADTVRAVRLGNSFQCLNKNEYKSAIDSLGQEADADQNYRSPKDRAEAIALVGNPSLSRINWMRFVIIADDDLTGEKAQGEIWINDMRLDGVHQGVGLASRASMQLDFARVMTISGDVEYREGDFATMNSGSGSPLPTRAEMATSLESNANFDFQVNRFFPDDWKLSIPFGLGLSNTVERPYVEPESDRELSEDTYKDFGKDLLGDGLAVENNAEEDSLRMENLSKGFQTFITTKRLSLGYQKKYVNNRNFWMDWGSQIFFERPNANFAYTHSKSRQTYSIDTVRTYQTNFSYKLGRLAKKRLFFNWWPNTFDVDLLDLNFRKHYSVRRNIAEEDEKAIIDYSVDLRHKIKSSWNIFPFLKLGYSLNISRNMNRDHASFAYGRFNSSDGDIKSARKIIMGWGDDIYDYEYEKVAYRDEEWNATNDSTGLSFLNNVSYGNFITTDTLQSIKKGSEKARGDLGKEYLFLRNERDRNQDFTLTFNPKWLKFLDTRVQFKTSYDARRSIPENFQMKGYQDYAKARDNYWTLNRSNTFEFRPTLKLRRAFGWTKGMKSFMKKFGLNSLRSSWVVNINSKGENFTLPHLERSGINPGDLYLYSLGLGDGQRPRTFWNIVSGDMGKKNPGDFQGFAEYNSKFVDSLVNRDQFANSIERKANVGTEMTIPWGKMRSGWTLDWKQDIQQLRAQKFYTDTITTWPKVTISNRIPNFARKWGLVKKSLKVLTLNNRIQYQHQEIKRPSREDVDEYTTKWDLAPILKVNMTTKKGIKMDNATSYTYEKGYLFSKVSPPGYADLLINPKFDSLPAYEVRFGEEWDKLGDIRASYYEPPFWLQLDQLNIRTRKTWSNKFHLGYALPTNKGIQFWKWFVRLKHPIKLDTYFDLEWTHELPERRRLKEVYADVFESLAKAYGAQSDNYLEQVDKFEGSDTETENEENTSWFGAVKQEASYQFTKSVDATAYLKYSYRHDDYGTIAGQNQTRTEHDLSYEIMVLVKF